MQRIRYNRFGNPEDVLEVEEVDLPEPGHGEVRICVEAAPVHLADLKHIRGSPWFDQYPPPFTPGYEGVGRISGVGEGVASVKEGDRVFLPVRFGAWAEEVIAPAADLWHAPTHISSTQLALVPINLSTAYLLLRNVVPLTEGDWIIQNAANSNVGYYLIRLCALWGIKSVNVVRRAGAVTALERAGGTFNLIDDDNLAKTVKESLPPGRLKLAIDAIAGEATTRLGACFGPEGGTVVSYGLLSGKPCYVPPEMLMLGAVTLTGFYAARTIEQIGKDATKAMHEAINDILMDNPPDAPIAATYSFENIRIAVRHASAEGAEREGKVVLVGRA